MRIILMFLHFSESRRINKIKESKIKFCDIICKIQKKDGNYVEAMHFR